MNYERTSLVLKAMADPKRMKIIDLLSESSLCACDVLEHFDFTQPTLSHHMKALEKAGIVSVTKQSQWHYYALREDFVRDFMSSMTQLLSSSGEDSVTKTNKEIIIK
ncbi:ArsR family transcriptional regulator [Listeria weihenstephanensis FSL R9-0317]|uniref:Transcriptional regulator n=1 Tax=Listeria weihenstephanensis TaxID=1006155 RepID=A0A1S7FRF8_9LIST|nr:metalloregulator ArsR/SmtB family transcription factor [Listeria weihenstephanensis]AQY49957.1 transcriptional regulator [Listeria weihenstephanensis]EUJ39694.1 ArsR family transcriptional regulator [Listeria weihenstephanensis FSL R9-0317]MBC1499689.1 winged helix-turn-helix transcriptional regulator [Listeria weihenstephanensis]